MGEEAEVDQEAEGEGGADSEVVGAGAVEEGSRDDYPGNGRVSRCWA